MKQLEREEPRELLKTEIASSRNQIKQLNAANDAKDIELNALRVKLTSNQEALATYEDVTICFSLGCLMFNTLLLPPY